MMRRKHKLKGGFSSIATYLSSTLDVIDLKSPLLQSFVNGPLCFYWDFIRNILFEFKQR